MRFYETNKIGRETARRARGGGFTLIEVLVASSLMIILCIGLLSVITYVIRINRGENLRMQALSVLQKQVEHYRSLKFVPVGSDAALNGRTETNVGTATSKDGRVFNIFVTIDNDPSTSGIQTGSDSTCKFKELTISAVPVTAETSWLANLKTTVTIQRVRSN